MPSREVAALHQRDRVAARGGVQRDPGAGDPAADHDDVELLALDRLERVRLRADHGVPSSRGTRRPGRRARARGRSAPARAVRGGAGRRSAPRRGSPTAARPSGVRSTSGVRQ